MKKRLSAFAAVALACVAVVAVLLVSNSRGNRHDQTKPATKDVAASATVTRQQVSPEPTKTVAASADFVRIYANVGQLVKASDVVVEGTVTGVSYFSGEDFTYTQVSLLATKVLRGKDVKRGDTVTVLEMGGMTTLGKLSARYAYKDPNQVISEADAATPVAETLDGAPLAKVGDTVVYFLVQGSPAEGFLSGVFYEPIGSFQGKFGVANGVAKRFAPPDMASEGYSSQEMSIGTLETTVINSP